MRCDVNVSVRPRGQQELGTKVEVKNMNSFSAMQKAIDFEIDRQVCVLPCLLATYLLSGSSHPCYVGAVYANYIGNKVLLAPIMCVGNKTHWQETYKQEIRLCNGLRPCCICKAMQVEHSMPHNRVIS